MDVQERSEESDSTQNTTGVVKVPNASDWLYGTDAENG